MTQQRMHHAGGWGGRAGWEEITCVICLTIPNGLPWDPPQELHLRKIHTPSWGRALHTRGLLAAGSLHAGLRSICLPSRCTRPSTSPSSPWPTPRALCNIFAAVPFGSYSAKSAFTSYPYYPCRSPCKIISFWNQRAFCTETRASGLRL